MRAALLERFGAPLRVGEAPTPVAGAGEVVVRTVACGICRTDVHMQDGVAYRPQLPHILGHEPAGRIASLGAGVSGWAVGDRVAPYLFDTCGHCDACHGGSDAQCDAHPAVLGVTRNGGFAEFFTVRADNLLRVPESVDLSAAGLVSCAVITAVHATRRAAVTAGQRVAVIGAGGIGVLIVQLMAAQGIETHVFDPAESARAAGLAAGAAGAHAPDAAPGIAFERVFDLVGTARSMGLAGQIVRRRGRIVVIGEEPEFPAIDSIAIAQRELEIIGSRNGSRHDAVDALTYMAQGVIRPRIADRIGLNGLNNALAAMRAGTVQGRIIVEFPQ